MITGLVRGMSIQKSEAWDEVFIEDIINHLQEKDGKALAKDSIAMNIQRGREHGIPGYNTYRELCGLKKATSFDDLKDSILEGKYLNQKLMRITSTP